MNNIHLHFNRRGHLTHWVLGAILLMATFFGHLYFQFYEYKQQHQQQIQNELSLRLHEEFSEIKETLKVLVSVYTHTESLDSQIEFASLTQGYFKTTPGLKQIGFAPYVSTDNLNDFIHQMKDQGYESYHTYNCKSAGNVLPSSEQDYQLPVQFVSPFTPSSVTSLGKNLSSLYDFNKIDLNQSPQMIASILVHSAQRARLFVFAPIVFHQHQNEKNNLEGVFF